MSLCISQLLGLCVCSVARLLSKKIHRVSKDLIILWPLQGGGCGKECAPSCMKLWKPLFSNQN